MADNEASDYASLTPSQAIVGQRSKDNKKHADPSARTTVGAIPSSQPRPKQANRNRQRHAKGPNAEAKEETKREISTSTTNTASPIVSPNEITAETPNQKKTSNRNRTRGRKNNKKSIETKTTAKEGEQNGGADSQQQNQSQGQKQQAKKNNNRNNKKPRKRYPWRRFIPSGTVDPITLENLVSLEYPPFALVADAPYESVPIWPIPEKGNLLGANERNAQVDIEELNRKRIAEQWGKSFSSSNVDEDEKKSPSTVDPSKRHYNLYDGRALAYYIVSQLQFIDPLNRRDLTRDELLNLDAYLRRHGFQDLNVTEAYDAKGITISSAGAVAATAQGRADIMQQMARNLLNSLFGGHSVSTPARREEPSLQEQYATLQRQELAHRRSRDPPPSLGLNPDSTPVFETSGVFISDDGGLMIIDDDENPGMRDGDYSAAPRNNNSVLNAMVNPFYSASHIAARHGSGGLSTGSPDAFPALPTPSTAPPPASKPHQPPTIEDALNGKPLAKPSKTLARITGAVKKTNPEEQQRQWEAREAARRRALMANMSFGIDACVIDAMQQQQGLLRPPPGINVEASKVDVSEEKLQRNKAFAEALGVRPATIRQSIKSGWARPTDTNISLDEFGNELNTVVYPDVLLSQARDKLGLLLKLEKKWKTFLQDDNAASLPLNPMDKPLRIFVHHYSDFWNLKTESFDPEPRRYIHCVKMLDTHMPYPLLSDAARKWRGPSQFDTVLPVGPSITKSTSLQTAGQPSKSREIPPPPERVPLQLKARSLETEEQQSDSRQAMSDVSAFESDHSNSRFGTLLGDRERPKIELAKRTVPLEMPPFEPSGKGFDVEADILERRARHEEKARRAKEAEEKKRRAIQNAFASDDEEDAGDESSEGSEWEEPEVLYQGSDDDE